MTVKKMPSLSDYIRAVNVADQMMSLRDTRRMTSERYKDLWQVEHDIALEVMVAYNVDN